MVPVLGLLLGAGGASAATTVGSQLTLAPAAASCGGTATFMNRALAAGTLQAPIDGVVLRWRLALAAPGGGSFTYKLRVLRPAGGGMYTGAGTGPAQTAPSTGVNVLTLASPLPVKAGDLIGIDCPAGAPSPFSNVAPAGSSIGTFGPPLADGEARSPGGPFAFDEMLINADVAPKPSNTFRFGGVARKKHKGTAILSVIVPGPGALVLGGKGIRAQEAAGGAVARKTVTSAGAVKLLVKPKGKSKRKLSETGKATINARVTYTPSGEIAGDPNTQSRKIKLVKKP